MTFSRFSRLLMALCAALWFITSSAPIENARSMQSPLPTDSPIAVPPFPFPTTSDVSPIARPEPDPIAPPQPIDCNTAIPCNGDETPETPSFNTFVPGAGGGADDAQSQQPASPPDLGTILNYVAIAIIVIGVPLRVFWWMNDRRKGQEE